MQTLALRIETIKEQVSAIDQVIAIYDPAHAPKDAAPVKPKRIRNSASVPVELNRINKTEAILEVLREAGGPLSTADCTKHIAERHGVSADDPGMPRFVTHVSAALSALLKRNRVRQAGTIDGHKHLWEIAT
ncbi:hypothetical protein BB934_26070 [Microvirga ossetica]|uniref:Uncharacterized protein n=1 Tax=Microvirga ossetica TaxID=1882682 RepID=A0A1B2EMN7_9HYPH|nr:hypothetical protein [Microvirga ossetica]ANY81253.1 hypothetical protein BB934_26070 [Microvirga ossetica]